MSETNKHIFNYWRWFIFGIEDKPGYKRLVNKWLILHCVVGVAVSLLVVIPLKQAANTVLIPLVGILIGLSFAWAGNALTLLQSKEMSLLAKFRKGGFIEYVYAYQTAILAILITVVIWGLAGLGVFDNTYPLYFIIKVILFSFISLTLRECWQVVLIAQWMLIAQNEIKKQPLQDSKQDKT